MHYNAQLNNELKTTSSFTIVKIIKHIGTNLTKRVQDIKNYKTYRKQLKT